jgi:hypothetical protein
MDTKEKEAARKKKWQLDNREKHLAIVYARRRKLFE